MPIRKGAHRIEGSTDGLAVLLYDAGRLDELRRDGTAAFVDAHAGRDPEGAERTRLEDIARRGLLVEYELQGDGPVRLEVAVGPPLGGAEKKSGRWLRDQAALLSLPSGRLCLDWGDVEEDFGAAPTHVDVPPGDYVATLHRRDPDAESDGVDVLTLTRAGEHASPPAPWPLLSFGDAAGWPKPPAPGTVQGNVFRGTFFSVPARAFTNAYRREVQALGLRFGARLALAFPGRDLHAVYIGWLRLSEVQRVLGPGGLDLLPEPRPELYATLELDGTYQRWCLYLTAQPSVVPPFAAMKPDEPRVPFTLTVLPAPYVPAANAALVTQRSVEGGEIRTAVLARHESAVILGAGEDDLERIKVKPGDALTVRFPSGERTAYYAVDRRRKEQLVDALATLGPAERKRLDDLEQKKADLGFALMKARSEPERAQQIRNDLARLDEETTNVRLPPEKQRTAPLEATAWRHWERDARVLFCRPLVGERTFVDDAVGSPVIVAKAGGTKKGTPKAPAGRRKR